jgi:nitroreductase
MISQTSTSADDGFDCRDGDRRAALTAAISGYRSRSLAGLEADQCRQPSRAQSSRLWFDPLSQKSYQEQRMITRRQASAGVLAGTALAAASTIPAAPEVQQLNLPPPRSDGGKPLTEALKLRRSTREYSGRSIPVQILSDLLWAAFGINRPSGDRTAPYWRHVMVIDIYLAMADGVWLFEPKTHALLLHAKRDIRAETGLQDFVATAPLNLIYVAHGERMLDIAPEERRLYASVDSGFIGQNVYLFRASEGLAAVFRGSVDYPTLARILQLADQQFVTFAQTVGYPHA